MANEPIEPLVNKIVLMVQPTEMNDFFTELLREYNRNGYREDWSLINAVMADKNIRGYFIDFVKGDISL